MKQTYSINLLALLSLVLCLQCNQQKVDQSIKSSAATVKTEDYVLDTIITKRIPLTTDGEWATINYHLMVKDWKKPVEWTFVVVNDKDILYSVVSSDDARIDTFFYDPSYTGGLGKDYLSSKQFWYLKRIHEYYCDTVSITDRVLRNEWKRLVAKEAGIRTPKNIISSLCNDSLWRYYENKPIIYYAFIAGVPEGGDETAWTYYPKIKQFAQIYAP